jgi:hypothetical protein
MESLLPIISPINYSYWQWGITGLLAAAGAVGVLGVAIGQKRPQMKYSKWGFQDAGIV